MGRTKGGWWAAGLVALPVLAHLVAGTAASAQDSTPSPRPPTLTGRVSGVREAGGDVEIRLDVLMPGGWQGLHLVEAVLLVDGREWDRMTYDIEDAQLTVGDQTIFVGTGARASGDFLRVDGARVVVTTGGGNLSLRADAEVLRAIPEDATFELSVTGDLGERTSIHRSFARPEAEGFGWGTVATAVVVALLAGAFVGNLVASRRRPPPRMSVYGAIQRRLDVNRSGGQTAQAESGDEARRSPGSAR